jgi:hypothetical protein
VVAVDVHVCYTVNGDEGEDGKGLEGPGVDQREEFGSDFMSLRIVYF